MVEVSSMEYIPAAVYQSARQGTKAFERAFETVRQLVAQQVKRRITVGDRTDSNPLGATEENIRAGPREGKPGRTGGLPPRLAIARQPRYGASRCAGTWWARSSLAKRWRSRAAAPSGRVLTDPTTSPPLAAGRIGARRS